MKVECHHFLWEAKCTCGSSLLLPTSRLHNLFYARAHREQQGNSNTSAETEYRKPVDAMAQHFKITSSIVWSLREKLEFSINMTEHNSLVTARSVAFWKAIRLRVHVSYDNPSRSKIQLCLVFKLWQQMSHYERIFYNNFTLWKIFHYENIFYNNFTLWNLQRKI